MLNGIIIFKLLGSIMSKEKSVKRGYKSELSKSLKLWVWLGLGLYLLGFIFLALVGDAINDNGYILTSFLAPFFTLAGIVTIAWMLFRRD